MSLSHVMFQILVPLLVCSSLDIFVFVFIVLCIYVFLVLSLFVCITCMSDFIMSNHLNPFCAQWDAGCVRRYAYTIFCLQTKLYSPQWPLVFGGEFFTSVRSREEKNKLSLMNIEVLALCCLSCLLISTCRREEAFTFYWNKGQIHSNQAASQEGEGEAMLSQATCWFLWLRLHGMWIK